jgi:hypothetical protein
MCMIFVFNSCKLYMYNLTWYIPVPYTSMYNTQPLIMDLTITDCNSNLVYNTHLCSSHKCLGKFFFYLIDYDIVNKIGVALLFLSNQTSVFQFLTLNTPLIFKDNLTFWCTKMNVWNVEQQEKSTVPLLKFSCLCNVCLSCSFTSIFFLTTRCINFI